MNVHHKPAVQEYDSIVFPSFEAGVKCMREVGQVEESLLPPIGDSRHFFRWPKSAAPQPQFD